MKKKIFIVLVALVFFIGGTYALIRKTVFTQNAGFSISGLDAYIIYNKGTDVLSGTLLDTESYTESNINTEITLYKNASFDIYGHIYLDLKSIGTNLSHNYALKWLIKSNNKIINEGNFVGYNVDDSIPLYLNIPLLNSEQRFQIYIWFDENAADEFDVMGEQLRTIVRAEATQIPVSVEPNKPELVDGLIPVKYDDTNEVWVKADSSNTNHDWYNYNDKIWANAVLVGEKGYEPRLSEENKSVSIDNTPTVVDKYTSSNQAVESSESITTLTFTTGSSSGTISFDYTYSCMSGCYFSVKLKKSISDAGGNNLISISNGFGSNDKSSNVDANSTYVLTLTYRKNSGNENLNDEATVSNIRITNLVGSIEAEASGDYGWTRSDRFVYPVYTYIDYFHYDDGTYELAKFNITNKSAAESVGNYICSDMASTTCDTIYKIKSYSGNTITAVDVYDTGSFTARSVYQNAPVGTEIKEDAILAYYVWIPRFKYKVFNINKLVSTDSYNAKNTGIDIIFESSKSNTGTISCNYDFTIIDESLSEMCTGSNGDYYTHPAFTFGDDKLTGIWVGKFEISREKPYVKYAGNFDGGTGTVRIKPNVRSSRGNGLSGFWKIIYDMQIEDNIYGLSVWRTNTDSHMLKNIEWGAISYLTNSKYGRCSNNVCTKVTNNNSSDYITGNADNAVRVGSHNGITNAYNTALGQLASTTGNIYGVYDMVGGSYEYVMGKMSGTAGEYTYYVSGGSNYTYEGNEKYIDTYAYGTSSSGQKSFNRSRLGDATGEVGLGTVYYSGNYSKICLKRGDSYSYTGNVFSVDRENCGSDYSASTRAVLVSLK